MPEPRLKVLLLAGRFEVRGSCAYTLRMAEYAQQYGIEPRIVCPDASRMPEQKRKKLVVAEYPYLDSAGVGWVIEQLVRQDFHRWHPDLIHIQTLKMLSCGSRLAADLERPFVLTVHDYPSPGKRVKLNSPWRRRVMAVSEPVKQELLKHADIPADEVTVVHSGVECPEKSETQRVLEPGHVPVVGTAGPLEAVKGIPYFLEAAEKVLATRSPVQFLVAGAGPEEENLRRLARDLGIQSNVTFAPGFYDFSVSLEAMDIFCLPSLQQGLGTIMLEAMALGKPVIASGVGGVYAVVHDNETGLVVPPSDSDAMARRILELLDDPERARRIGEQARALVRDHFNVQEMVRRTVDVYRQSVAQTAQTPH
ncbi:MAG TPA: glycosyltransferase family 1 protein [Planctomycetaceae bacterium]|nr:glycosyltransferase family 1 protein [Planctomycetaceae bacterium]